MNLWWSATIIILFIFLLALVKLYTTLNVKWNRSPVCLIGKTAIVTGSNTGIGYYTALDFAKRGARVILACRNAAKAEDAKRKIIESTANKNVVVKILDLSSLDSVRQFAKDINETEDYLHILVNNAGAVVFDQPYTKDGFKSAMQINHLSPFLLTILLIPLLKKSVPSRVVVISSILAALGKVNINKLNSRPRYFSESFDYVNTKLFNLLFTIELSQKLKDTGVTVNAVHPGVIMSDILKKTPTLLTKMFYLYMNLVYKTSEAGAETSNYVAVAKELDGVSGEYFMDCAKANLPRSARNKILAKNLWEKSLELVNLTPDEQQCLDT